MEKERDLQRWAEEIYSSTYNFLLPRLKDYKIININEIRIVEDEEEIDKRRDPQWKPDGKLLIPKEMCSSDELLSRFIAKELIRSIFWQDIHSYRPQQKGNEEEEEPDVDEDRFRITFGALKLINLEYLFDWRAKNEQPKGRLVKLTFLSDIDEETHEILTSIDAFAQEGFEYEDEKELVANMGLELYDEIIPSYILYKLHKKLKRELTLENTLKISFNLQRAAALKDLKGFLEEDFDSFEAELPKISDKEKEQYRQIYQMFFQVLKEKYGLNEMDANENAQLFTNSYFIAKRLLLELELNWAIRRDANYAIV